MKLHHRKEKGIWIVSVKGRLDAQSVADFKKVLNPLMVEEAPQLLFDLRDLEFIDSTGLGAFISILRKLESKGGDLTLTHITPEVESILEITRLNRLFKIKQDHAL